MVKEEHYERSRWPFVKWSPPRIIVAAFAGVILLGALLLTLPISSSNGESIGFLNALFTATSAVCVTGLVVVDTGTRFSTFGQVVIMGLIQVGGLGIASAASLALILGRRITLRERILLQQSLNQETLRGVVRLTRFVLITTLIVECVGTLLLAIRFVPIWGWTKGLYFALFHAISAFNNAGFDLMGNYRSFLDFQTDPLVLLVVAGLLIVGGIGFPVIFDLHRRLFRARQRDRAEERGEGRLFLHTQVVLVTTLVLLVVGTLAILLLEAANPETLGHLSFPYKLLNAFFQAAVPRTAGFNSVPIGALGEGTLFLLVILMYIGASPASTGGGIKTSTFAAIVSGIWSTIRGYDEVTIRERRLARGILDRALAVAFMGLALIVTVTILLTITEGSRFEFIQLLFETTSAFGTVGLSTGITPQLSAAGRLLIIMTMFLGRVGPLTFAMALAGRERQVAVHYPEESVIIG